MNRPLAPKTAPGLRQFLPMSFGPMARLRTDPLGFLLDGRRRFGDVFRFQVGPFVIHLLAHPDHVKRVLVDEQANYERGWAYNIPRLAAGEGLVTTDGPAWRRLRRMIQPAFHRQKIEAMAVAMTDATEVLRRRWRARPSGEGPLDVAAEFIDLTLRIVGRTLLGVDLGGAADRIGPAIATAMEYVQYRIDNMLAPPLVFPTRRNLRFRRAMGRLDALVFEIIAGRRREPCRDADDLLARLLAARDEETGEGLTDREIRDQLLTFIVAGHETTAAALAWTFHLLGRNPEAAGRLHAEVADVLQGRTPAAADLPRLGYARRVVEESLRIYPTVFGVLRSAGRADAIGGCRIPARSQVLLSPYVTQRHPDFWPDPEAFDPDRFLPERAAARPRFAWFPFLGGPHQCIGQEFAMMEAVLVVAMIAQEFRLHPAPGVAVEPKAVLSLRPRDGLPMTIQPA
ncbi:cytochrome P450 [Paludisphaera mucosa]|uniref:Cytochrome P450 n=1 Tax=Paludisphaera mucosa TaxID=3030827 RepID=A0ABT6FAQ9_9BACT|nr:cytochrome P450 [Paludisphaera mucosa]MDG3004649.1 cytochrome P450 [Paludisphaera mucosa]